MDVTRAPEAAAPRRQKCFFPGEAARVSQSGARVQVLHCHVVRRAVEVGRELGAHNQLRHRRKLGHGGGRQKGSEVVKG